MEVKEFEDNRWAGQDQEFSFRHKAALELIEGGAVLDLGCGDGLLLKELANKGIAGEGVDLSDKAIEKCQTKGVKAAVYDITKIPLPFSGGGFDYVVALDVLEHLYFPEKLLGEMARISNKYIIVGVPNFNSLKARLQMLLGGIPENNIPKKGHVFWFNYKNLKSLLEKNSFKVNEIKINTYRENGVFGFIFKFMAKIWPSLFALSFIIKAEKQVLLLGNAEIT